MLGGQRLKEQMEKKRERKQRILWGVHFGSNHRENETILSKIWQPRSSQATKRTKKEGALGLLKGDWSRALRW